MLACWLCDAEESIRASSQRGHGRVPGEWPQSHCKYQISRQNQWCAWGKDCVSLQHVEVFELQPAVQADCWEKGSALDLMLASNVGLHLHQLVFSRPFDCVIEHYLVDYGPMTQGKVTAAVLNLMCCCVRGFVILSSESWRSDLRSRVKLKQKILRSCNNNVLQKLQRPLPALCQGLLSFCNNDIDRIASESYLFY